MHRPSTKLTLTAFTAVSAVAACGAIAATPAAADSPDDAFGIHKVAEYAVGSTDPDGGVAEIVSWNKENSSFYLVNGSTDPASLEIVAMPESGYDPGAPLPLELTTSIDIVALLAEVAPGFTYGDLTSVAVSTASNLVYVAVQEADFAAPGLIVALGYDGEYVTSYEAGVQPDMVTTAGGGRYVLTADEGEPRDSTVANDPEGTITVVDTKTGAVKHLGFGDTDKIDPDVHVRGVEESPAGSGLFPARGLEDAVTDFEPEYITVSGRGDDLTAYVSLQENNAIATVDVDKRQLVSVHSLGLKDHSAPGNEIDVIRDGAIGIESVPAWGQYMPDGVASYEVDGETYVLSANEGDAAEFIEQVIDSDDLAPYLPVGSAAAEYFADLPSGGIEVAADMGTDGVYLYGARSFSIWSAGDMQQVFDSGSDFEDITAERLPDYFNISNDDFEPDDFDKRSNRKGPEPEGVTVGQVAGRTYAFVGLERIGGVMTYDVTDPAEPLFVNYVNTRDFPAAENTDNSPEGLDFIPASESPTGTAMLLVAFEVGGRVAAYELDLEPYLDTETRLRVRDDEVKRGGRLKIHVRVDTDADYYDATGKVRVVLDGRVIDTVKLGTDGRVRTAVSIPKKTDTGKARIVAKYVGDGQADASRSQTERVRITKK